MKTSDTISLDYSKIDNVEIEGIDHRDHPDYCDAYIVSADYDGRPMTDDELEALCEDADYVWNAVWDSIH